MKNLVLALLVCGLAASPAFADSHSKPSGGDIALDLLIRPVSLLCATASTALFIATMPLTVPTGVSHDAAYLLLAAPWRFTAGRYIGEWDRYTDGRDIRGWTLKTPRQERIDRRSR